MSSISAMKSTTRDSYSCGKWMSTAPPSTALAESVNFSLTASTTREAIVNPGAREFKTNDTSSDDWDLNLALDQALPTGFSRSLANPL